MNYKRVYEEIKEVVDGFYAEDSDSNSITGDEYMESIGAIIDAAEEHDEEVAEVEKLGLVKFVEFLNDNVAGVRIKVELVDEFLGQ